MMTNYGTELEKLKIQKKLFAQYTMFFRQSIHTARLGGRWKGRLCTTKPNQQTSKKLGSETTTGRIMSYNSTTESVSLDVKQLLCNVLLTSRKNYPTHFLKASFQAWLSAVQGKRIAWLGAVRTNAQLDSALSQLNRKYLGEFVRSSSELNVRTI